MKIECIVCGKEIKRNQKVVSIVRHEDFRINGLSENEEVITSVNFYVSKKTLHKKLKIVHVDCFSAACREDLKF